MSTTSQLCGLLNLHKPRGMTSRDVVNRVQRLVRPTKVGHAGTLDPLATGVLLVPIGPTTRLVNYLHRLSKRYVATFELGASSPTEDSDGPVTRLESPIVPTPTELEIAAGKLVGRLMQRPPAFSAIHVAGRRAYDLARRGTAVELAPRPIVVHSLAVREYKYPRLVLDVSCGTGTYVRSLGRDLAESLGTAAVMTELVRTAIGEFRLKDAVALDRLSPESLAQYVRPAIEAVSILPHLVLSSEDITRLRQGQRIARGEAPPTFVEPFDAAIVDADGALVGIAAIDNGVIRPRINF